MNSFIQLLFWPTLLNDHTALSFGVGFLIYGAFFVMPILGLATSLYFMLPWSIRSKKARTIGIATAIVSVLWGWWVYYNSTMGQISISLPVINVACFIIGPTLLALSLLNEKTRKTILGSIIVNRKLLLIAGILFTYFVSAPILAAIALL